ncbi:hypothetical protein PR202_ga21093 [Eleusine coracana subsp. coracana]|uniref:MIR domain-containing protein n=1 Tax=Eleusine coracana subsp. coracana TaxID=191504 RepID=A0AAV5D077_ELECO|nr:hypothetical protein PR202_ga21093 [Eleusine coracana subsp. coracana]
MAASLLALAVALLVGAGAGVDRGVAAPVEAEGTEVTYGSVVKLMHEKTKHRLHSHDVPYGSGSGQQSVTGFPEGDDSNSYWVSCFGGDEQSDTGDYWRLEIEGTGKLWKRDQKVRLRHVDTGGYLHSHNKKYNRLGGGQQEVKHFSFVKLIHVY